MANIILVAVGVLALFGMVALDAFISKDIHSKKNDKNQDE